MKTKNILLAGLFAVGGVMTACSDFTEINEDPNQVNEDKVQPQWLFNNSVIEAQMNPEIAERIFILKWNAAARFNRLSGFTIGSDNNDYNTLYLSTSYAIGWLNTATKAVQFAEKRINSGVAYPYESNIMQMARIWRAYLMAEVTDCFGPIPSVADSFDGDPTPSYSDEKSIYEYILTELAEAQGKLDTSIDMSDVKDEDAFYAGDVSMWQKYANSLRMRYAMRISNVDADFAKAQFVAASALPFISEQADIASVQERSGWSALTGVMTREWNGQQMSVTYKNLVEGLGDCEFSIGGVALPDSVAENVKDPRTYMGEYIPTQFPTTTNDPCAGYFFDGIPKYVDPRAPLTFCVVGWNDGTVYPSSMVKASNVVPVKLGAPDPADSIVVNPKYTWTTCVAGIWDTKSAYSSNYIKNLNLPLIAQKYRTSELKRVFFGPWESYFLIAEAALKGWVSSSAQTAYEKGIEASFTYMGVPDSELANYLESTSYNRVGTSVAWNHTTEAQSYQTTYTDPYDGNALKTVTYNYPKNSIYKNGTVNNDQLTKILTQKYIAQVPWLPLEAWADHRRLGLPFFENQAVEIDYNTTNYLPLTVSQSKECKLEFYPKRFAYPATLKTVNNEGYKQALQLLGGIDKASTPLWWCLK